MSKRVANNIERGLWITDARGYTCVANYTYPELTDTGMIDACYTITYHAGEMPAFVAEVYATFNELVCAMRVIAPIRCWHLC